MVPRDGVKGSFFGGGENQLWRLIIKKEFKEFYMPASKPEIVNVPKMNFVAAFGSGDHRMKAISIMLCLHLKAFGGRMESLA